MKYKNNCMTVAAALALSILISGCGTMAVQEPEKLQMEYYYYPTCESCTDGEGFAAYVDTLVADVLEPDDYEIELKNMAADGVVEEFEKIIDEYQTDEFYPSPPVMKVGDTYLFGLESIETEIHRTAAEEYSKRLDADQMWAELESVGGDIDYFVYFYKEDCPYCIETDQYLSWIASQNKSVHYMYIDIGKTENMKLANEFYKKYKVPEEEWKAPMLFWKGGYFFGTEAICEGMEEVLADGGAKGWKGLEYVSIEMP